MEKERTANQELRQQVQLLSMQVESLESRAAPPVEEKKQVDPKMEEKLAATSLKLTMLEAENAKLTRALKREVGEFKSIDELLKEENGAKLRAQQIEALKAKLASCQQDMAPSETRSMMSFKKHSRAVVENRATEIESLKKTESLLVR